LGRGRFTADGVNGAAAVRFARSTVARGRIRSIAKPHGALVFTAADLPEVTPIRPLLHRSDYVPIAQPVLAVGRVHYVGEAFAVIVAGHAAWDEASGRVTLTCSVQMPHMLRTGIADALQMPEADLRVIAPDVGGGFGQKMQLFPEYIVLVWLARRLRRSVAWLEDRHEN